MSYEGVIKYWECHVTVEPVFDERLKQLEEIAGHQAHRFQVADLLMQRGREDTPTRSSKDSFCTARARPEDMNLLLRRMNSFGLALQEAGFKVWRVKVEAVVLDERNPQLLAERLSA